MQKYGLVMLLPNSKHSSPIFALMKPSGKLRIVIDLRRVNHLLCKVYSDNNFPISIMREAVHHFAGKTLITKLECSQAYHSVQMADPLSVQILSFNFASRTYASTRLAQGLIKSATGFSSFVRNYLDSCLAANLCTQFMDDIGCGVEPFKQMIPTLRQIFDCLRKSGLRFTSHKCEFGMKSITFLGNSKRSQTGNKKNREVPENYKSPGRCETSERTCWIHLVLSKFPAQHRKQLNALVQITQKRCKIHNTG